MRRRGLLTVVTTMLATLVASMAIAADRLLLPAVDGDEVLTILLLGSDEGPPRTADVRTGRADGIQLLFVSGDRQHATFISIPRDSWINVPGRGTTRINACLNNGPQRCVETVEAEFGIDVDAYFLTSMRGFANAIKRFGGITVDVPTPVRDGGHPIDETGVQELTGLQALAYARDRKNRPGGDFGRSKAQAELLAIAHQDMVADGSSFRVLEAVSILRRHALTDIPPTQLVRLAFEAMHLPPENIQRELAPARLGFAGAASVAFLEPKAYDLVRDAAKDARLG